MGRIKALWKISVYLREWMKLCIHYLTVWEFGVNPAASREEKLAVMERIRTGPLRYEYERVERIKLDAVNLWFGTPKKEGEK